MTNTTLSVLLLAFICCGWPLIVHAFIVWIKRRDWSNSGDVFSKFITALFHKNEEE